MVSGFTVINASMIVGTWMRQKMATIAAKGMWIGSGMKQIASPAPKAGATVRRCNDQRRGSAKNRLKGLSAQCLRSVSLRGVIFRKSPRGIGRHFNTRPVAA